MIQNLQVQQTVRLLLLATADNAHLLLQGIAETPIRPQRMQSVEEIRIIARHILKTAKTGLKTTAKHNQVLLDDFVEVFIPNPTPTKPIPTKATERINPGEAVIYLLRLGDKIGELKKEEVLSTPIALNSAE